MTIHPNSLSCRRFSLLAGAVEVGLDRQPATLDGNGTRSSLRHLRLGTILQLPPQMQRDSDFAGVTSEFFCSHECYGPRPGAVLWSIGPWCAGVPSAGGLAGVGATVRQDGRSMDPRQGHGAAGWSGDGSVAAPGCLRMERMSPLPRHAPRSGSAGRSRVQRDRNQAMQPSRLPG